MTMAVVPVFATRLARALVAVLGVGVALASLLVMPGLPWNVPGSDVQVGTIRLVAGAGLVAAGTAAWLGRPGAASGTIAILAGVTYIAPAWEATPWAPPLVRSIASVGQWFFLPLVANVAVAFALPRPWSRSVGLAISLAYASAALVAAGHAFLRDPFLDPACLQACRYNVFMVTAQPDVMRLLAAAWQLVTIVIGGGLVLLAVRTIAGATRTAMAVRGPIVVPAALIGSAAALAASATLLAPNLHARAALFAALLLVSALGVGGLASGIGVSVARAYRTRSAMARLATRLGEAPAPGTLGAALASATGDPSLEVVYPLPAIDRYVDAAGRTVDPPTARHGRAVTPIALRGQPIAFVLHDDTALDLDDIRPRLGAATRLAIENERLRAEVLAQLDDLRVSRARLVETSDAERRRLERDLHDGAQQRLLALGYDLRLARQAALGGGDHRVLERLEAAISGTDLAISELRDLARGIYPAILTEGGIGPAVWSLTDASPVAVEIVEVPTERFAEAVERTAFEVVAESVDAADAHGAHGLRIQIAREGDRLLVEVEGIIERPFAYLADRVGALGGRLVTSTKGVRAEIPCASS